MGLALVHSRARAGIHAPPVQVEVHLSGGLPSTKIVGLPAAAVREARDRVRAAILCAHFVYPQRRITINLAPADLPKDGGRFDLPIALGILAASGQIERDALADCEFLGELGLTGELRPVDGVLPAAVAAARAGRRLVVPAASGAEAALVRGAETYTARTLLEACAGLRGQALPRAVAAPAAAAAAVPDMADVRGQAQARRALETAAVHSISGRGLDPARWRQRPLRTPHHGASPVALAGGGSPPRPGEISLAHNGVLFLDELPEWSRAALEVLREPLESGRITVSRAGRSVEFPARFQLVAAMNPCPCGWAGDPSGRCRCTPDMVRRYRDRISGPLLDRIDLHLHMARLPPAALRPDAPPGEPSAAIRARVEAARARQQARGALNAHLDTAALARHCRLSGADQTLLEKAVERLRLTARGLHRALHVARTIADLEGSEAIATAHLAEALGYRVPDPAGEG